MIVKSVVVAVILLVCSIVFTEGDDRSGPKPGECVTVIQQVISDDLEVELVTRFDSCKLETRRSVLLRSCEIPLQGEDRYHVRKAVVAGDHVFLVVANNFGVWLSRLCKDGYIETVAELPDLGPGEWHLSAEVSSANTYRFSIGEAEGGALWRREVMDAWFVECEGCPNPSVLINPKKQHPCQDGPSSPYDKFIGDSDLLKDTNSQRVPSQPIPTILAAVLLDTGAK